MTFALGCGDAGQIIDDLTDAVKSTRSNIFRRDNAQTLWHVENRGRCLERIDRIRIQILPRDQNLLHRLGLSFIDFLRQSHARNEATGKTQTGKLFDGHWTALLVVIVNDNDSHL